MTSSDQEPEIDHEPITDGEEVQHVLEWIFQECNEYVGAPSRYEVRGKPAASFGMSEVLEMFQENHPRIWGELLRAHKPVILEEKLR